MIFMITTIIIKWAHHRTHALMFSFTLLQHTCDTAVQKAAKLESLHTEQLRLNQVLSDRTSTLEGENALLTNKVSDVNEQLQL